MTEKIYLDNMVEKLLPQLDRHMILQILTFLEQKGEYSTKDILEAQYEIAKDTYMVDLTISLWEKLHGKEIKVPKEINDKRKMISEKEEELKKKCKLDVLTNPEVSGSMRQDKIQNILFLKENYDFTDEAFDALFEYGKFQYNCGRYLSAADLLYHYRILSTDSKKNLLATWGKYSAEILSKQWSEAIVELGMLKEMIDSGIHYNDPVSQLNARKWLLHWSLFFFFNGNEGHETLVNLFFSKEYINTIQNSCPWLLRYLCGAVITSRAGLFVNNNNSNSKIKNSILALSNYQKLIKELTKSVKIEGYEYNDAVTEFISALYIDFNFDNAQEKLANVENLLKNDFFLHTSESEFMESARHMMSELYCRIHQKIDLTDLSKQLGLSHDEGEQWIANLIRDSRSLDAKIDYSDNSVVMNHPVSSVYQQIIERTKGLSFKSTQILSHALKENE